MKDNAGGLSSLYSIKDNILVMWIILSYTINNNTDLIIGALNSADSRVHTLKVFIICELWSSITRFCP